MDWIEYIKTNEDQALKDIYSKYKVPCIHWVISQYKCDPDEALEIFQLTVLILYDKVLSKKITVLTQDLQYYLMGIAKNKARELIRKKQKTVDLDNTSVLLNYLSDDLNEDMDEQLSEAVRALEELGEPCKSLLELYYYNDLSMEEITVQLGYKNSDTTKNLKYKCLKRLQTLFFNHVNNKS